MVKRVQLIRSLCSVVIAFLIALSFFSCQKKNPDNDIIVESSSISVGTFAGTGANGFADGLGNTASFSMPTALTIDASGNVYVSDTGNGTIRKINNGGYVTTFAGTAGDYSSPIGYPYGIAADAAGNIYLGDVEHAQIRKISPLGVITTLAGNGNTGFADGPGTSASFNEPYGIAVDAAGNVYVADAGNNAIRKITVAGMVSTLAGNGTQGMANGTAAQASFYSPYGVAVDGTGNVFVADTFNQLIRKITPGGTVSTVAGGGSPGSEMPGYFGSPFGVALDVSGNLYVADFGSNQVLQVNSSGVVAVLAGSGKAGDENGPSEVASFNGPSGLVAGANGNIFVADYRNNLIREIFIEK